MNYPLCILTMYHCNPNKDELTIHPNLFKQTLKHILNIGYNFITYQHFKDMVLYEKSINKKQILLTFYDGYYDFYKYAYPILKELKIPAVCFLITNNITNLERKEDLCFKKHKEISNKNKEYFLNLDEIHEMQNSGLIDFDSHTQSHFSLKSENESKIKQELDNSYLKIKEIFSNKKEFGFCYPKGQFNALSYGLVKKSKYDFAFSVIDGAYYKGDDIFQIKRIDISTYNNEKKYIKRINKKLFIYSMPMFGKIYSNFRNKKYKQI